MGNHSKLYLSSLEYMGNTLCIFIYYYQFIKVKPRYPFIYQDAICQVWSSGFDNTIQQNQWIAYKSVDEMAKMNLSHDF